MRSPSREMYVRIESRSEARDATSNEPLGTWAFRSYCWAHIRPKRGREQEAGGQVRSSVAHVMTADFYDLDGVTPTMRVVFSPSGNYDATADWIYYEIEAVMPDWIGRQETTLEIRETTATGTGVT